MFNPIDAEHGGTCFNRKTNFIGGKMFNLNSKDECGCGGAIISFCVLVDLSHGHLYYQSIVVPTLALLWSASVQQAINISNRMFLWSSINISRVNDVLEFFVDRHLNAFHSKLIVCRTKQSTDHLWSSMLDRPWIENQLLNTIDEAGSPSKCQGGSQ